MPPSVRFTDNERNVLVLTGVAHAATHYAELMYPTLAVALAHETGLPLREVLAWSFAGYLLFGVGALPAGYGADHFGARPLLIGGLLGMSLATILAGASNPGLPLAVCLALLGCAGSLYHPAGMGLISHTIAARGRALGINGVCGNLGIALTPIVTAALATRLGWRGALWVSGGLLFLAALVCARLPIDEPAPVARVAAAPPARRTPRAAWSFALLCGAAMLGGISYRGNTIAQPAYFAERVSIMGYGAATSLAFLVGVIGQYCGGVIADRVDLRRGYLAFHAASLPALLAMSFLANLPLLGAAGVFTFFSLGMQPIENSLFAVLVPARWRSTGYGVKFVLTFGVGSLAVWLVGWLQEAFGLPSVFLGLGAVVATLVLVIVAFGVVAAPVVARRARIAGPDLVTAL
jgi:MFS family permease